MEKNNNFILKPTDEWLKVKTIKSLGASNYVLFGKIFNKDNVVIKILNDESNEYLVCKILKKLDPKLPNLPKIYGSYSCSFGSFVKYKTELEANAPCFENMEKFKLFEESYNKKNNKNVNVSLCGSKDSDIKIRFIVIENLINSKPLNEFPKNKSLPDYIFLSILLQCMYHIYGLYYIFGIVQNDYNLSNILIEETTEKYIEYKFYTLPNRHYKNDKYLCYDDEMITIKIESKGVKVYLIDYDNAMINHKRFREDVDISANVIKQINSLIKNLSQYGSNSILLKLKKYYDNDRLYNCNEHLIKYYNENRVDDNFTFNDIFLLKSSILIKKYIDMIIKEFNLPKKYKFYQTFNYDSNDSI